MVGFSRAAAVSGYRRRLNWSSLTDLGQTGWILAQSDWTVNINITADELTTLPWMPRLLACEYKKKIWKWNIFAIFAKFCAVLRVMETATDSLTHMPGWFSMNCISSSLPSSWLVYQWQKSNSTPPKRMMSPRPSTPTPNFPFCCRRRRLTAINK